MQRQEEEKQPFLTSATSYESTSSSFQVKGFDLNTAFLPQACCFSFNQEYLISRKSRVQELLKWINEDDYAVITFQEMFDPKILKYLIKELTKKQYQVVRGISIPAEEMGSAPLPEVLDEGIKHYCLSVKNNQEDVKLAACCSPCTVLSSVRGGLVIFSKLPILETSGSVFSNPNPHVFDVLVQKGFLAIKVKLIENNFLTIYTTHLNAGGRREAGEPTNSERRGEQLNFILLHMKKWATKPPPGHPQLQHVATLFAGDTNINLAPDAIHGREVNNRRMLSISSGKSNNGKKMNQIKYKGQYDFFSQMQPAIPKNFRNIRYRDVDGNVQRDEKTFAEVKENPQLVSCTVNEGINGDAARYASHKMLDIVTINNDAPGELSSTIVVKENSQGKLISDHHAIKYIYNFAGLFNPWKSKYAGIDPQCIDGAEYLAPPPQCMV